MKISPLLALLGFISMIVAPSQGVAVVVTDGLLYLWSLDETTGTTSFDSIAGRNMESRGGPAVGVPGISGSAYAFDGTNDYLTAPSGPETFGAGDFTLSVWVRTTSSQTKLANLLFHQSSAGWFELTLQYDGRPYLFAQDYQTRAAVSLSGGMPLNDGQWHLLSLVRKGHSAFLYADSTLVASVSNELLNTVSGTGGLLIGGSSQGYYKGTIDDVAIYSRALSPSEIASNAIPEPSTTILLLGGACAFLTARKRLGRS